ncbi:MAG: endolytic transglycosylase MltG [Spirochaetales bacterium]|nr:endolytic transglycosylase MltG [Spirochaetales bacterium]
MARRLLRSVVVLLVALILLGLGVGGAAYYLNSPSSGIPEEGGVFRITQGESLSAVASRLEAAHLIRSGLFLRIVSRLSGSETSIKSGYYRIMPQDTTVDVHSLLVTGYQEQLKLTIPEGWTLKRIARYLEDKQIAGQQEFLDAAASPALLEQFGVPAENLEGYLFPDTYYFPEGYPAYGIVEEMVGTFFRRLGEIAPEALELDRRELHERVIMASIVEREYRRREEAPLIASVFYNRLRFNIGLESCATLGYIITDIEGRPHPEYLTIEDKKIDSPYNTYKWAGLPPGPISNPGLVALEAALHPPKTEFYYFVLKDPATGEHYFSEDLGEHNWAKYQYLKQSAPGG